MNEFFVIESDEEFWLQRNDDEADDAGGGKKDSRSTVGRATRKAEFLARKA